MKICVIADLKSACLFNLLHFGGDFFFNLFFNWRINALENCLGFCQTSAWFFYQTSTWWNVGDISIEQFFSWLWVTFFFFFFLLHNLVISLVGTTFWFNITECLDIILPLKNVLADIWVICDWISFFGGLYSTLLGLLFRSLYSWANLALLLRQNSSGITPKYSIYSLRSFCSGCLELEHLPSFTVSPVWIVMLHWKMSFPG